MRRIRPAAPREARAVACPPLPDGGTRDGLLYHGDNLALLEALPRGIADLVVTDPPFGTQRRRVGRARAASPPPAFEDRWDGPGALLAFLRPRLVRLHSLLAPRGSLVIHLDHRAVHAVKLELDRIFGPERFVNEIIWHYTGGGRSKRFFSRKHDSLLWYARGPRWTFNLDSARVPYAPNSGYARSGIVARSGKRYLPHPGGTPVDDVWDIPIINPLSAERCGFPTQKPERLLERIISALSHPGDLVVDPFCGSGTTAVVAQRLKRGWIAADISAAAIALTQQRLQRAGAAGRYAVCALGSRSRAAARASQVAGGTRADRP